MEKGALLAGLHGYEESVLVILRGKEPLLTDPVLHDVAALARARWALVRALAAYRQFKHHEVFDPAIARRLLGAMKAERLKRACDAMDEEFRGHVTKWSACDVAGEWADYQPAALRIVARLREHIARERQEIAALLDMAA